MTWREIKKAVQAAGIKDDDEICIIECETDQGDKSFYKTKFGDTYKLTEKFDERAHKKASGCTC